MIYSVTFNVGCRKYQLVFHNQLNLIYGDSSTGKSTICKYIVRKEYSNLQCSGKVKVARDIDTIKYAVSNSVVLIDSDDIDPEDILDWVASVLAIKDTSICVVWFGRHGLSMLPFAVQNTYTLETKNRFTHNVPFVKSNQLCKFLTFRKVLVEDSKSGYNFFRSIFGETYSLNGNGNILNNIQPNSMIVFDAAGFGSYIMEFLRMTNKYSMAYIGYQSFEGFILETLFGDSEIPTAINIEKALEDKLRKRMGSYSKTFGCTGAACNHCDLDCKQSSLTLFKKSQYADALHYYEEPNKVAMYLLKFDDKDAELQRLQSLAEASGCTVEEILEDLI